MRWLVPAIAAVTLAACPGPAKSPPQHAQSPGSGSGSGSAAPGEVAPSEADCDALIAHAVALAASEDARTTAEDQARARADLRGDYLPRCRAMSRSAYQCALAAPTSAALAGCGSANAE